jgi:hypothetical protein
MRGADRKLAGLWRQGCKRPYVAYFGAAGVGGRPAPHAWLSRSTHGLRARLAAPPNCLDFTLPLAGAAGAAGAADPRKAPEVPELGQARALQRHVARGVCRLPARMRNPTVLAPPHAADALRRRSLQH